MISSQKTPFSTINFPTGVLLGVFLGVFPISFVMWGIWAFIVAMMGGISYFIIIRCVRIINPSLRGAMIGLVIGNLTSLIILGCVGLRLNLSTNLWAAAAFTFTMGMVRMLIPDSTLVSWLKKLFPRLILNDALE